MPKVKIWINNQEVMADEGANLLEAAIAAGFDIPHLCHDPRLQPFGSCRLCFVSIEGGRGPVPSCGNVVKEGIKVTTDSDEIYSLRRSALELLLMEHCGDCLAPCQLACPAHIDIQGFIAHMANGRHDAAAALIKETLPLPSVCGRVCPRFCEEDCRRNIVDEPVDICALKRYAGDYDLLNHNAYRPKPAPSTGKTVAVVGGGPAGLTAAYYLALAGHSISLYDAGPELGGMLRYGIPEYRMPKETLDQEIKLITDLCAEVRLGEIMGKDFTLESLLEHYDAVFVGIGSQSAQKLGLAKEDTPGILNGIGFLRDVAEGRPPDLGAKVVVVGGGNTAMDAARTSVRLGASEVTVVYRRSRDEMPANPVEVEEAIEEGVKFAYLTNPVAYLCGDDCVEGIECVQMKLGAPDASGRRRPIAVEGSQFSIAADTIILAIGQSLRREEAETCGLTLCSRGNINADHETGATDLPGVFSAGDCVTGPATVVEAVGAAKRAVLSIQQFLEGRDIVPDPKPFNCSMGELDQLNPSDFAEHPAIHREHEFHMPPAERSASFVEYNLGFDEESVRLETTRCLACGCQDVFDCELRRLAARYSVDLKKLGTHGKRYDIQSEHPYIVKDQNKCILCGNCVRICAEVQDVSAWGFVNRGFETCVLPSLGKTLSDSPCESCSQCLSACPTGALTPKTPFTKQGPWKDDRVVATTCVLCGTGCNVEMHVSADRITSITSPIKGSVNSGNLCKTGAFAAEYIHSAERLAAPQVNNRAGRREASWNEAISEAASILAETKKSSGAQSLAVLVSPNLTNEENYLAQKLAREVLGTDYVDSTRPVPVSPAAYAAQNNHARSYDEVEKSDFILVVNADLPEDFSIAAQKVRRAVTGGGKLVLVSGKATRLDKYACRVLPSLRELEGSELPAALKQARNPVVIIDGDKLSAEEQQLVRRLTGCNPLMLYRGGNARGQLAMGVHPNLLPGSRLKSTDELNVENKILSGEIKALLILGDDYSLNNLPADVRIVAVAAKWRDDLLKAAVVLPAACYAETAGTIINCEGRVSPLMPAIAPPAGKNNLEILQALATALGRPFAVQSLQEIQSETRKISGAEG